MKNLSFFCIIFALLSTIACNNDTTALDQYFDIAFGESASVSNFDIEFADVVEESRCPTDAACIWEGRVVVSLVIVEGTQTTDIELATENDIDGTDKLTAIYNNNLIELITVNPYPDGDMIAPEEDYLIVLEVTDL